MNQTTVTITVTDDGKVILDNHDRIGSIREHDGAYWPSEGRTQIHSLPPVPITEDDDWALERAACAVVAWHTLKIEQK